jgi:phage terminase small subunit
MESEENGQGSSGVPAPRIAPYIQKPFPLPLNAKQARFVGNYLTGMGAERAAIQAGYSARNAYSSANRLLHKHPAVIAAIKEAQGAIAEAAKVTAESMVKQFDEDRRFAVETENASAAVRASEMKAKLCGLLIDRQDIRAAHSIKVEVVRFGDAP